MSAESSPPIPFERPSQNGSGGDGEEPQKPKLKKFRFALILFGLSLIAITSSMFGMLMALASDLPSLENREDYKHAKNSVLLDARGRQLSILTGNQNRILVRMDQIAPAMKHAIIAIEDKRFYENQGFDVYGMTRALFQDVTNRGAVQGASTITQQFVKNALQAQDNRTVFQKLKEAAVAYHLTRQWSKQKILTEYLNAIYFGNGAYGIESAARVYFGKQHPGCGNPKNPCASQLQPYEAALIAGVVASPSAYDPVAHPVAARDRRNLVLRYMRDQHYLTPYEYEESIAQALPAAVDIQPPSEKSASPYFTSWIKQQVVDRFGARRAFSGGLRIHTSLDLDLQAAAEQAVNGRIAGIGPSSALVVIENKTGAVRAMVGGSDYQKTPFNLATQGQRQPGSAFKPFTLAAALKAGISPESTWESRKKVFNVPGTGGKEKFEVNNYDDAYAGVSSLSHATIQSDNSVYAEVGIKVGTKKIAKIAERMGIRSNVSTNYAITLGGLKEGVTALDMAHAYETFAENGDLVYGTLSAPGRGPVGILDVRGVNGDLIAKNRKKIKRVLPASVATTETGILQQVVSSGTAKRAAIDGFAAGKTGTTENYGDAWFVGYTHKYTVAVWVGYADKVQSMETEYAGEPVAGGTFPSEIWHDFIVSATAIDKQRWQERKAAIEAKRAAKGETVTEDGSEEISTPTVASPSAGEDTTPAPSTTPSRKPSGTKTTGGQSNPPTSNNQPDPPAPQQTADSPTPEPKPQTPTPTSPSGGAAPTGGAPPPTG